VNSAGPTLVLAVALLAANLPFFSERILLVKAPSAEGKSFAWRLLEIVILYLLVGGLAWLIEGRLGPPHGQGWEFYAITFPLFLVFAFPGFVYRYLWQGTRRR
jgi:hypothetical protein